MAYLTGPDPNGLIPADTSAFPAYDPNNPMGLSPIAQSVSPYAADAGSPAVGNVPAPAAGPGVWKNNKWVTPDQIAAMRKQAEALQAQGMSYSPIQSPWQGLARVADALLGTVDERQAEKASQAQQTRMMQLITGQTPDGAGGGGSGAPADPSAAGGTGGAGGAPQQSGGSALSLTGNPQRDQALFLLDPSEYLKGVISAGAPTDLMKTMRAMGIDPNSATGRQILQANVAKTNYIEPVNVRQGGAVLEPGTNRVIFQNPKIPEGASVTWDASGTPTAVNMTPGAAAAIGAASGAQAGGQAAGKAPYTLVTVTGPDGKPFQIPSSFVPGMGTSPGTQPPPPTGAPPAVGAPPAAQQPPGAPAPRAGLLNGFYRPPAGAPAGTPPAGAPPAQGGVATGPGGVGVQTGLGPQQQSAATTSGTNSANFFNEGIKASIDAKAAAYQLHQILANAAKIYTGPGAAEYSTLKSGYNVVANLLGVPKKYQADPATIASFDEIAKGNAALATTLAKGSGNSTDAQLAAQFAQLPASHYSPQAIQAVGAMIDGRVATADAYGKALAAWQQQHGPQSADAFQSAWLKVNDPELFVHYAQGPKAFTAWVQSLPPAARQQAQAQYQGIKALGGF
jgi:hypothetical protein